MGITKKAENNVKLEREIDTILEYMAEVPPDTDGYSEFVNVLEKLYKMKSEEKKRKINLDTLAIIAGNLLGIILILGYEKANVITSKALNFIIKGRV